MIDSFSGEYRFLSNFWTVRIEDEGIVYPSVEHAYVANKTLDMALRRTIASVSTAGQVKRLGRTLELREDWDAIKYNVMGYLVEQKFRNHFNLAAMLKATGTQKLVEGNTWGDTYWGVCNGKGQNKLGEILMIVREDLKNEQ